MGSALTAATSWTVCVCVGGLTSLCETHVSASAALRGWKCAVSAAPRWDNCTSRRTLPRRLTSQMKWEVEGRFPSLQGFTALGSTKDLGGVFSLKNKTKKKCFQGSFSLEAASPDEQHDEIPHQGGNTANRLIPEEALPTGFKCCWLAVGRNGFFSGHCWYLESVLDDKQCFNYAFFSIWQNTTIYK